MRRRCAASVAASFLAVCAALSLLPLPASCLYEEEAGTFDWLRQHVGEVEDALFSRPSAAGKPSKTAFVRSAAGVVAAVRTKTGSLAWRQVMPEGEGVAALALDAHAEVLASASAGCAAVRVWGAKDGRLEWEDVTAAAAAAAAATGAAAEEEAPALSSAARAARDLVRDTSASDPCHLLFVGSGDYVLSVSGSGLATLRRASDGVARWQRSLGAGVRGMVPVAAVSLFGALLDGGRLELFALDDGAAVGSWPVPAGSHVLTGALLAAVDGGDLVLTDARRVTGSSAPREPVRHALSSVSGLSLASPVLRRALTPPGSCPLAGPTAFVELRDEASGLSQAVAVSGPGLEAPAARGGAPAPAVGAHCSGEAASSAGAGDQRVFVASHARHLVVRADHTLACARGGAVEWARDEALASVEASAFLEAPPTSPFVAGGGGGGGDDGDGDDDDDEPEFPPVWRRLPIQARMLADSLRGAVDFVAGLAGGGSAAAAAATATASGGDPFGFDKRVLAVTRPGRVFSLRTLDGSAAWSLQLLDAAGRPLSELYQDGRRWRFEVRVTGLVHAVVVATPAAPGGGGVTRLWNINTRTGAVQDSADVSLRGGLASVQRLAQLDSAHHAPLVLLAGDMEGVAVFPDTDEARALVLANAGRTYFSVVSAARGTVRGARLVAQPGGGLAAAATWTLAFPADVERVATAAFARDEPVQSSIRRVAGGTEALHKWLNPHLVVVATVRSASAQLRPVASVKKSTDPSVGVYLVDGVTGAVVERFTHRHGQGPVEAVVSENAVYYQFFDAKSNRFELCSVELYHDTARGDPSAAAAAGDEFSSFGTAAPVAHQRTFHLEGGASAAAMGVTSTRRGIADKNLLLGLGRGQVVMLQRRLTDPRRPHAVEASAADKADGLVPYRAVMPLAPQSTVSYHRRVARVRAIDTHHALLESTSLVFARGLDLFYTRVTPSAGFDMLSEDFNAPFLLVTVFGVVAATLVARALAARKRLALQWS